MMLAMSPCANVQATPPSNTSLQRLPKQGLPGLLFSARWPDERQHGGKNLLETCLCLQHVLRGTSQSGTAPFNGRLQRFMPAVGIAQPNGVQIRSPHGSPKQSMSNICPSTGCRLQMFSAVNAWCLHGPQIDRNGVQQIFS